MPKYNIYHVDTCLPDYFGGRNLPWFSIPVEHDTTFKEIKKSMLDWQTTEHLSDDERLGENGLEEKTFKLAVEELFYNIDLNKIPESSRFIEPLPEDEEIECSDYVYMFFVIETEKD